MTDDEWYEYCIRNKKPFMFAHINYRREFAEVEYHIDNIKKEALMILKEEATKLSNWINGRKK